MFTPPLDRRSALAVLVAALSFGMAPAASAHGPGVAAKQADAAFAKAKPVLQKYCSDCHTSKGSQADEESMRHFSMDTYPLGGHHSGEITQTLRKVLGVAGEQATMPE